MAQADPTSIEDFSLPDQDGNEVSLSSLWGQGPIVVYFYPKDDSPGCTKEACSFRDSYEAFTDAGARVVGISGDSPESHKRFAEKHRLPFTLLSDEQGLARKRFGVKKTLGLLDGRVTFVLDPSGRVVHRFSSQINMGAHIREALQVIQAQSPA